MAPAASGSSVHRGPVQAWVVQQARNLLMDLEDAAARVKFVLYDRDASFTLAFDAVFRAAGVRDIRSAAQAPRMNSITEPSARPPRCARYPMPSPTRISSGFSNVTAQEA